MMYPKRWLAAFTLSINVEIISLSLHSLGEVYVLLSYIKAFLYFCIFNKLFLANGVEIVYFYVRQMHFLHIQQLFTAISLILGTKNVNVQQKNRNYIF